MIEQVSSIKYLNTILDNRCDWKKEVKLRVRRVKATFVAMKNVLARNESNVKRGIRLARCYVYSILTFGYVSRMPDAGCGIREKNSGI